MANLPVDPGTISVVLMDGGFRHFVDQSMRKPKTQPVLPKLKRPGRNDKCPCGSGLKFKKCCRKPKPIEPGPEYVGRMPEWKEVECPTNS